jgi:hypothetical protein
MFMKLEGHYIEQTPKGFGVGSISTTITLGNGTTVEMPIPLIPIGNNLAVTPALTADGDTGVRVDFSRWTPTRYGRAGAALFPRWYADQSIAVKVCRAFDADPTVSWDSPLDAIHAWATAWVQQNLVH